MEDLHFRSAFFSSRVNLNLEGRVDGPLSGLTVAIKDMFDIKGERASGGSPAWLNSKEPAQRNSSVVVSLLEAGASVI